MSQILKLIVLYKFPGWSLRIYSLEARFPMDEFETFLACKPESHFYFFVEEMTSLDIFQRV